MDSVLITDFSEGGHRRLYFRALCTLQGVTGTIVPFTFTSIRKNPFVYFSQKKIALEQLYNTVDVESCKVHHILDIDSLYASGKFPIPLPAGVSLVGTIHHMPENRMKLGQLKRFASSFAMIIVHSPYMENILHHLDINNCRVIDYPVFHTVEKKPVDVLRTKHGIDQNRIVLSALGGTRRDKGLDIFLRALQFLPQSVRKRVQILVAGSENYYKRLMIERELQKAGVDYKLHLDFLDDEVYEEYISLSDAIVLPYRKYFTGNSGPMVEAVSRGIPVICPSEGNLGYLASENNLGITFSIENVKSLSSAIKKFVENGYTQSRKSREYAEKLKLERFLQRHEELYKELMK
jgi:glycosyltransferase involved in cell wall biosynthesis